MKKAVKIIISVGMVLFFAGAIFYCTVAGAPGEPDAARRYMLAAGAFSLLLPSFVCGCIHYISYLQKKVEEQERNKEKDDDEAA